MRRLAAAVRRVAAAVISTGVLFAAGNVHAQSVNGGEAPAASSSPSASSGEGGASSAGSSTRRVVVSAVPTASGGDASAAPGANDAEAIAPITISPTYIPGEVLIPAPPAPTGWRLRHRTHRDAGQRWPVFARRYERHTRWLAATGGAVFGVAWLGAVLSYVIMNDCGPIFFHCSMPAGALNVPLVGPFVALGGGHLQSDAAALIAVEGAFQIAGLAMFVVGMAVDGRYVVVPEWVPDHGPARRSISVRPMVGGFVF